MAFVGLLALARPTDAQTGSATVAVDCGATLGSYLYYSSRINVPFYFGCSYASLSRLQADMTFLSNNGLGQNTLRVFMNPETVKLATDSPPISHYDAYLDAVTPGAPSIVVAFSPPGPTITTLSEYQGLVDQMLDRLKTRYPTKTFYIEAVNEPDLAGMSDATYYTYYTMFVGEVNLMNGRYPSTPAMKVGGPVFSSWNPTRLQAFFNNYGADHSTSGLRLDFVSYHEYASFKSGAAVSPDNLQQLKTRRSDIETMMSTSNGVPGHNQIALTTPAYITEAGIYAGGNFDCGGYPITSAIMMQAASIATMNYYYVANGNLRMLPMAWADRFDQHQEKSIFVPQSDQVLTPFGHTVKLLGRLDSTRVTATLSPDPTTITSGFGIYALPTIKSNQVAVLVWNWRHDDTTTTSTSITMSFTGLPSGFAGHTVHLTRYLVDSTHSNYLNAFANAGLYTADSINNAATSNYTFNLENNAVSLILLDPM